uniref:Uncharacterized protein n=1 Tax=Pithovirus LCPAC403 TaxID=2506596 RepID=A0A481ZDH1_9VIRU|nr:MAG: uncharacterized protein LCPAC403_02230 [Pithovirus LCPAC403]
MTRLVCRKYNGSFGELGEVGSDFLIFLDKRKSPLSVRVQKSAPSYRLFERNLTSRKTWDKNAQYIMSNNIMRRNTPYNVGGDYFVDIAEVNYLYLRTHTDFIAYVNDTDQEDYEIVDIPKGKKFTEISTGLECEPECVIVVSDNFIQVYI